MKAYYHTVRGTLRLTRRKNPKATCLFCDIKLTSKFGGRLRRKYCDSCSKDKTIQRVLNAIKVKRYYRRKHNLPIPPIDYSTTYGRLEKVYGS